MTSSHTWKDTLKPFIPEPVMECKRKLYYWLVDPEERTLPLDVFRWKPHGHMNLRQRTELCEKMLRVNRSFKCAHTHAEMLEIVNAILESDAPPEAIVVEAGCYKGGSTAKLSLVARHAGRKLTVFDSFEGLPAPASVEAQIFHPGDYCGQLEEVKANVRNYGDISVCEFVKGWFSDTMPGFKTPIAVAFADVDLVSSVQDCLKNLYPLLVPGGSIFSHDGHLPVVVKEVLGNPGFWKNEVRGPLPELFGLGTKKLVRIRKPRS